MNDPLDHAIRSALADIVATAPAPGRAAHLRAVGDVRDRTVRWRLPAAIVAAACLAVIGLAALAVTLRDDGGGDQPAATPEVPQRQGPAPGPAGTAVSTTVAPTTAAPTTSVAATTTVAPTTAAPTTAAAGGAASATAGPCPGSGPIPAGATDVQTITGDIDGDVVDDTVTLYSLDGAWHVHATSSVKGWDSDAVVSIDVHDTMSINFEDIDHSAGAATPPPVAVMATGQGANDKGILANFTFLTNTPQYCIQQWTYKAEPFQWVALQTPGHMTGMVCDGAAGTIYYTLVDSEQNGDGSWHVITRRLTHNFTTADIQFLPEQDVADSPAFADQYGNIVGCGHAPVSGPTPGDTSTTPAVTTTTSTAASTTSAPSGASGAQCAAGLAVPAGATNEQTITGDIDGDVVADTVTLYALGGAWYVYATSSVQHTASITPVQLDVQDSMSIAFSDIDYSGGAPTPPPLAVMAIGTGANDRGIQRNFTFLTNHQNYCIGQWTYDGDPFQWVELQASGHVTGMDCEGAMGSVYYVLNDAVQKADGTWHVVSRRLTHDFTVAKTETLDDKVVPDSSSIVTDYGTLTDACIQTS